MPSVLDRYLGIHPQALRLSSQRTELIATNMANADTPNYKAKDLDFKAALSAQGGSLKMTGTPLGVTQSQHIPLANVANSESINEQYRVPLAPSLDGNTVDVQMEQANFAQNAVRYQATLTMLNGKFRSLLTAITGQ